MASLLHELHPRRFFLETWTAIDDEAAAERGGVDAPYDYRPLVVLTASAVLLSLMHYFGKKVGFETFVAAGIESGHAPALFLEARHGEYADLAYRYWWAGFRVLGYLLVPMAIVRFGLSGRLREYGLSTKDLGEHAGTYGLAFLVVFACVVAVSFDPAFVGQYPFYEHAGRSLTDLLLWEVAYAAQFFSLEFFYRGFMVNALRRSLGSSAIFVVTVPYCMVHFGKPLGETLGAVLAGVFLGTLALRTRSIWSGFFLHVGIAISMDVASLLQTGRFPTRW